MTAKSLYFRLYIIALYSCVFVSCVPVVTTEAPTGATGDDQDTTDTTGSTDTTNLAVFSDPDSEFTTMDVLDIDDQIVRFDTQAKTLVWAEDGSSFDDWQVDGNRLSRVTAGAFQVRFGMVDGVQHAYFTEIVPATICNIEVVEGIFSISATQTTVPQ